MMILRPLLILLLLLLTSPTPAGDEDMSPSAYHVFDPETGYMITVDPMDEEQPATATEEAGTSGDTPRVAVPWVYGLGALVLVGGLFAWSYRRRKG